MSNSKKVRAIWTLTCLSCTPLQRVEASNKRTDEQRSALAPSGRELSSLQAMTEGERASYIADLPHRNR